MRTQAKVQEFRNQFLFIFLAKFEKFSWLSAELHDISCKPPPLPVNHLVSNSPIWMESENESSSLAVCFVMSFELSTSVSSFGTFKKSFQDGFFVKEKELTVLGVQIFSTAALTFKSIVITQLYCTVIRVICSVFSQVKPF